MEGPEATASTEGPDPERGVSTVIRRTERAARRARVRWFEWAVENVLFLCSGLSILTTFGILAVLISQSVPFFREVSPLSFLFGTNWSPLIEPRSYGVLPLVCGTMLIVGVSAVISVPAGLAIAVYLSEYASPFQKQFLKPYLEVLAGIPTIVYGYFALTMVTPILRWMLGGWAEVGIFNALSAGIVVGIMILPMVASLCEDSLRAVPVSLRQGAYALGATSAEVTTTVVVPAALSGVLASFILAISRALGETMAVAMAAGSTPKLTVNPLESVQTMTAFIVAISKGDTPYGTTPYYTLFAVGLLLFLMTFGMNVIANRIQRRYREVYE